MRPNRSNASPNMPASVQQVASVQQAVPDWIRVSPPSPALKTPSPSSAVVAELR